MNGELPMLAEPPVWTDEQGREFDPYLPVTPRDAKRAKTRYYMVEGRGAFPADMLRYDRSWAITGLGDPDDHLLPMRTVVLATRQPAGKLQAPTVGRWESFGWKVLHKRLPFDDVQMILGGSPQWTGHCQRCGKRAPASTPSHFSSQIICLECMGRERQHPDFHRAEAAIREALMLKDNSFLGIGWRP